MEEFRSPSIEEKKTLFPSRPRFLFRHFLFSSNHRPYLTWPDLFFSNPASVTSKRAYSHFPRGTGQIDHIFVLTLSSPFALSSHQCPNGGEGMIFSGNRDSHRSPNRIIAFFVFADSQTALLSPRLATWVHVRLCLLV